MGVFLDSLMLGSEKEEGETSSSVPDKGNPKEPHLRGELWPKNSVIC
jgi:hypothetical protein